MDFFTPVPLQLNVGTGQKGRPTLEDFRGSRVKDYHVRWMRRNQHKTTRRAEALLHDARLPPVEETPDAMMLDLGCGTGFSSEELAAGGRPVVGMDLSKDMLAEMPVALRRQLRGVVQADLRRLPFRARAFPRAVSISTLNFVAEGFPDAAAVARAYDGVFRDLYRVVTWNGRAVVEYYPRDEREKGASTRAAKAAGFTGFLVIDHPGLRKERTFLLLEKKEKPGTGPSPGTTTGS